MIPEAYRVVHYQDMVPHNPAEDFFYHHSTTEIFEDKDSSITICSATNGEDPNCSNKYWSFQYDVASHGTYLGMCMGMKCG